MSHRPYTRNELLKGIRERDNTIVSYIDLNFKGKLLKRIMKMGGSMEDGLDIYQDTMIILMLQVEDDTFEFTANFKSLFLTIGINRFRRRLKYEPEILQIDTLPEQISGEKHLDAAMGSKELYALVLEQVENIRELCRKILALVMEEKSPKEIAETLEMEVKRVYDHKNKCLGELITRVKKHPDYKCIRRVEKEPVTGGS